MIVAHSQPNMLRRLVDRLGHSDASVFVHVDRRSDSFRRDQFRDVTFLEDRIAVHWAGFSMVLAVFKLLEAAIGSPADRFVLLSGVDYPLVPAETIRTRLAPDMEYIQVDRRLVPGGNDRFDLRAEQWFFGDIAALNPREGPEFLVRSARKLAKRLPRRKISLPVYYGPNWWALTRTGVEQILEIRRTKPEWVDQFKYCFAPDEMVFQSLLKTTDRPIAFDSVDQSFIQAEHQAALHHVNGVKPNPRFPRILDMADLPDILNSTALFARKMDFDRSSGLLDAIDGRASRT